MPSDPVDIIIVALISFFFLCIWMAVLAAWRLTRDKWRK